MVKRGMLLSETKNGRALLDVDGRHYLLLMETTCSSAVVLKAGMLVNVHFNAEGAPERVDPVFTLQLETHP